MDKNRLIIGALAQQQVVCKKKVGGKMKIIMWLVLTLMIILISWPLLLMTYL